MSDPHPRSRPTRARRTPQWVDRFLGSDPGLTRLRVALQAVVTIGAAMAAEWLFVRGTGALQSPIRAATPAAQAAQLAVVNHALLVVAIMPYRVAALASLAAILAVGTYCRRFGPLGFLGGMVAFMGDFFGFFLHGEVRLADLGWLSAQIVIGVLVAVVAQFSLFYPSRRAGLRRMTRSYTARARDVARRSITVFDQPDPGVRAATARRLRRRLVRLNETALMIDAQLADPAALPSGWSAAVVHQAIFDAELALTNMARFTERVAEIPLPALIRALIREALTGVAVRDLRMADEAARALSEQLRTAPHAPDNSHAADDTASAVRSGPGGLGTAEVIVLHRFATSVSGLVAAGHAWRRATPDTSPPRTGQRPSQPVTPDPLETSAPFETSVALFGGWLPGSATVSAAASLTPDTGSKGWGRVHLAPYLRVAIQIGVAVTGAILLGDLLSGRRFYWAVIAAFVTFMGAHNAGEQLRKGFYRVAGTVIGVLLGAIAAHLVGDRTALAIAVILVALFIGLYLMRISYAFMVIAITILVSQLYVQLGEFTDSLLVLRLEETALGAAVAAVTVLCVFPLRTGRVARVATRQFVQAVAALTDQAIATLLANSELAHISTDIQSDARFLLRKAARDLDAAYQALLATMTPMPIPFTGAGDHARKQVLRAATAARHYARNLIIDTETPVELSADQRIDLQAAGQQLADSLARLAADQRTPDEPGYTRAAALFTLVANSPAQPPDGASSAAPSPLTLALRDLQLIDGAMASLADLIDLPLHALDTTALLDVGLR